MTQSISALFIISDSLPIQNKQNKICVYLRCPMGTFALSSQLKKKIIKPFRLFSKNSVHLDGKFLLFTVSSVFYIMNFTSIFNVNDHAVLAYSGCKLQLRPECFGGISVFDVHFLIAFSIKSDTKSNPLWKMGSKCYCSFGVIVSLTTDAKWWKKSLNLSNGLPGL